jgi:allantoinase
MLWSIHKEVRVHLDQRIAHSPVVDRPPLILPSGSRMVVWPIVVLEKWDIARAIPRQVVPPPRPTPDYLNWSWHEYGMRIGFWRLKELLDSHGIKAGLSINSAVCAAYPRIATACRDAGWEFMGHGVVQRPISEISNEPAMIAEALQELERFTGQKPSGWASPGIAQSENTLDYLAEAGIEYVCDWVFDDQPCDIRTEHGTLVAIPYSVDLNDVPAIAIHKQSAQMFAQSICDSFDRLYAEAESSARIQTIVLHPYICAASHRIRYLEEAFAYMKRPGVVFWTGKQILEWYRSTRRGGASADIR